MQGRLHLSNSTNQLRVLEDNTSTASSFFLGGLEKSSKQVLAIDLAHVSTSPGFNSDSAAKAAQILHDELRRNNVKCEVSSRRAGRRGTVEVIVQQLEFRILHTCSLAVELSSVRGRRAEGGVGERYVCVQ